uniref:Uncharacterized protein n=1 Tax=Nelumbo nucifera TaxID=4432 RepID=A0A822YUP3_NELNU|nr:TPA_asm: hypothetical protein HUJ06_006453 [Nelumbo nucifera]
MWLNVGIGIFLNLYSLVELVALKKTSGGPPALQGLVELCK